MICSQIETLAERIRRVPINGTLHFSNHPQAKIIIDIAKMFIVTDYFKEDNFSIVISNDYTAIIKKERFNFEAVT